MNAPGAPAQAPAEQPAAPARVAGAEAGAGMGAEADMARLRSDFELLRVLGFVAAGLASACGLAWYALRHKRVQPHDTSGGLLISVILAPLLLTFAIQLLSTDSAACLELTLGAGADLSSFFDACRAGRESVANLFGLKYLWATVFGQGVAAGVVVPFSAALVKVLMFTSVTLAAPVFFLLLKPLLRKTLVY
jgi:hypothetical protein